jgi:hypothetical protein
MRTSALILITILLASVSLKGQDAGPGTERTMIRKNSVYLEILGNGAIYSLNYDRIIPLKRDLILVARIGGNEYHGIHNGRLSWNLIATAGLLVGTGYNFFEPSLGFTCFQREPDFLIVLATGYRHQGRRGLVFRATPMYIINTARGDVFGNSLWLGLSLGYAF